MNSERKYVAVSIKHTENKWKFGMPCVLWGWHQTEDNEPRCFADYTIYLSKAERYGKDDFLKHGYGSDIVKSEIVTMCQDFCKKWKKYDTVLVDAEEYAAYCKVCGLATNPKEEKLCV